VPDGTLCTLARKCRIRQTARTSRHTPMELKLPADLRAFIEDRVRDGGYASEVEYVRDLIRRDRERQEQQNFADLVREALSSGPAQPITASVRSEMLDRIVVKGGVRRRA